MLLTEREGRLALLSGTVEGASVTPVDADLGDLLAQGEGGLMGMVVHPDFAHDPPVHHLPDAHRGRPVRWTSGS